MCGNIFSFHLKIEEFFIELDNFCLGRVYEFARVHILRHNVW